MLHSGALAGQQKMPFDVETPQVVLVQADEPVTHWFSAALAPLHNTHTTMSTHANTPASRTNIFKLGDTVTVDSYW